jgi:hypothetical protein
MPAAGPQGLFGPSFDDPHERATSGALVNGLALNGLPAVLAVGHTPSASKNSFCRCSSMSENASKWFSPQQAKLVCWLPQ